MHTPQEWLRQRTLMFLLLVSWLLFQFPGGTYALYPVHLFSSWIHELFHGLAALVVGGHFENLKLYPDGSGMALTSYPATNFTHIFVASAGYVGTTVTGICLLLYQWPTKTSRALNLLLLCGILCALFFGSMPWKGMVFYGVLCTFLLAMTLWPSSRRELTCRVGMAGIAVLLLTSLLFVRDWFPLFAIPALAMTCFVLCFVAKDRVVWLSYNVLSLVFAFQTLFYVQALFSVKHLTLGSPSRPSDASLIEAVFFLASARFWSLIWLLLSLVLVSLALVHVFLVYSPNPKKKRIHPWR